MASAPGADSAWGDGYGFRSLGRYLFRYGIHYGERMFSKMNFITETSWKVLNFLVGDPQKEFFQREVALGAGVSIGSVNQILRILSEKEMVKATRRGKMIFYRYNLRSPLARQLKVLLNVAELDDLVRSLSGVSRRIVLFGSCAEGSDVKESDIDLFILSDDQRTARRLISREARAERRIAPIIFNVVEFSEMKKRDKPLYDQIMKGLVLWEMR